MDGISSFGILNSHQQQRNEFEKYPLVTYDPNTHVEVRRNPATGDLVTYDPAKARAEPWYGSLIKALAIGGVGAGFGAAGLAALGGGGSGIAGGLGLSSPETLSAFNLGPEVFTEGAAAAAPETAYVTGSLAAPGLGAAGNIGAGALGGYGLGSVVSGAGGSGGGPAGYDSSGNPVAGSLANPTDVQSAILNAPGRGVLGTGLTGGQLLGGAQILGAGAGLVGGGGIGGLGTTTTTQNLTPQQQQYLQTQIDMANKQLQLLDQQGGFQSSYLDSIRPLLDQQTKLMQQQYDAFSAAQNDPLNAQMQKQASTLLQQQIDSQNQLAPLQQQLLEAQLKQAINGGNATPEQLAQIDAATSAAFNSGQSDINSASTDALTQLREQLAPGLGLRPTDTPILDRGDLIQKEAVRQLGQLRTNLAGTNATARINLPLAQQQIGNATANNTANIATATQQFQQQLAQAAINNRMTLLSQGNNTANLGLSSGANLISAAKGGIPNFGGSTTVSNPGLGFTQLLGGLGGLGTGLGALGLA